MYENEESPWGRGRGDRIRSDRGNVYSSNDIDVGLPYLLGDCMIIS